MYYTYQQAILLIAAWGSRNIEMVVALLYNTHAAPSSSLIVWDAAERYDLWRKGRKCKLKEIKQLNTWILAHYCEAS